MSRQKENKCQGTGMILIPIEEWEELNSKIDNLISIVKQRNNEENTDEWLDIKGAAKLLHVSERTILRYREKRLLRYYQCGNNILFKKKEIEQFIEQYGISAA